MFPLSLWAIPAAETLTRANASCRPSSPEHPCWALRVWLMADRKVTGLLQRKSSLHLREETNTKTDTLLVSQHSRQTLKLYTPTSRFKREILEFSSVINIHTVRKEGGILLHTSRVFPTELKVGYSKIICQTARKGEHEQTKVCDSEQISFLQYTGMPQRGEHWNDYTSLPDTRKGMSGSTCTITTEITLTFIYLFWRIPKFCSWIGKQ